MNTNINQGLTLKGRKILIGVSGSIAAIKTPLLVSSLVKAGAEVRCIITPSASHLISPLSLSTLSRHKCYQDQDQWDPKESKPLHIKLSEWAEVIVVAPLSATSLARWVHGMGDGLLASVLLASECPVIAAAAMNTGMWGNQSVQNNWKKLGQLPRIIRLDPSHGFLACDRIGEGKVVNEDIIRLAIESALIRGRETPQITQDFNGLNLLVTAGATVESLDPARYISNRSSGLMGLSIAQAGRFRGAHVDLIYGNIQIPNSYLEGLNAIKVQNSLEMQNKLKEFIDSADFVSMTAAISDLRRRGGSEQSKSPKKTLIESLTNELELVPDLLSQLNSHRRSQQVILGFAAITGSNEELREVAAAKRINKRCDFLMANPIDRKGQGFAENLNGGFLVGPNAMIQEIPIQSKFELANKLLDELLEFKSKLF